MIIRRYVLREVTLNFFGVSLLLTVMVLSTTLIRLLNQIIDGDYPAQVLLTLFALKGVGNLVFIVPLAFFLAVLLAFGRLYRDSEMVVLGACGVRPGQLMKVVGLLGGVIAVGVVALSLFFSPWVERYSEALIDEASAQTGIEGVVPGQFNQGGESGPVIYAESFDEETRRLQGIFVQHREAGVHYQLTAARAYEQISDESGSRYLILEEGYRYEGQPGQREYRIMRFREHGIRLQEYQPGELELDLEAVPSQQLLGTSDTEKSAELQWRLMAPFSVLLLGLLAVPLSKTTPRRGRFGGLALGFMIYFIYNNLLLVARSSVAKGDITPYVGMWWVPALLFVVIVVLYRRGDRLRGPAKAR